MKFGMWLAERNQRDATKSPKRRTNLELQRRAAAKRAHDMVHGRAGKMETKRHKGSKGSRDRESIDRSARGE